MLKARVNALAASMAKPLLLTTGIKGLMERLHMPPVLPDDDSTAAPPAAKH